MNPQSPPSSSDPKSSEAGFSGPSGFSFGSSSASTRPPAQKSDPNHSNGPGPQANPDSPAANLARRKWSGPIAEEAQAHAAAWRATQQIGPRGHSRAHSGEVRVGLHPGSAYSPFPGASPIGSPSFNSGLALPPHNIGRSRNASPNVDREAERNRFVSGNSPAGPQNGLLLSAPTPPSIPAHKRKRSEGHQSQSQSQSNASPPAPAPSNPFGGPYHYSQTPPGPLSYPTDHDYQSRHGLGSMNQGPRPPFASGPGSMSAGIGVVRPPSGPWEMDPNRAQRSKNDSDMVNPDIRARSNSASYRSPNPLLSPTGMGSVSGGRSNPNMPSTSPHQHHQAQFHHHPHQHGHHQHHHQAPESSSQTSGGRQQHQHHQHSHSHSTHLQQSESLPSHNHSRSKSHGPPLTEKEIQLRAAEEAERKELAMEREREKERMRGNGGDHQTAPSPHHHHHHHHHHPPQPPPLPIPHRISAEDRDRERERERAEYYSSTQGPASPPHLERNPNGANPNGARKPVEEAGLYAAAHDQQSPPEAFALAHHPHSHLHAQHQNPRHHHHHHPHHHHHHAHQKQNLSPSREQNQIRSSDRDGGLLNRGPQPQINPAFELVEPEPINARRSPTTPQPQSPLYSQVKLTHDFNSGPQVNNLPVWEYLEKWKRIDRNPIIGRPRGGTGGSVSSLSSQVNSVQKAQEASSNEKTKQNSGETDEIALKDIKDRIQGGSGSLADELRLLRRERLEKERSGGGITDSQMQDSYPDSSSKFATSTSNLQADQSNQDQQAQINGYSNPKTQSGSFDEENPEKKRGSSHTGSLSEPAPNRHLGSFRYDPLIQPLLPGQLLASNVGATIEVRIAGETLGPGVGVERMRKSCFGLDEAEEESKLSKERRDKGKGKESENEEITGKEKDGEEKKVSGNSADEPSGDSEAKRKREEEALEEKERLRDEKERDWFRSQGRWRLGWRGREYSKSLASESVNSPESSSRSSKRMKLSNPPATSSASSTPQSSSDHSPYRSALNFWSLRPLVRRKLWGTDVYADDSDVLAMCVHAGWLEPPSLLTRDGKEVPNWVPPGKPARKWLEWDSLEKELAAMEEKGPKSRNKEEPDVSMRDVKDVNSSTTSASETNQKNEPGRSSPSSFTYGSEKERPCDLSVMLRIAPALIAYKGSQRAGIKSRSWGNGHDGVSLYIESVELKEPGYASSSSRKSSKDRINHLAKLRLQLPPQRLVSLNSISKNQEQKQDSSALTENEKRPFWDFKM